MTKPINPIHVRDLQERGFTTSQIARIFNVTYHCIYLHFNPKFKLNSNRRRDQRKRGDAYLRAICPEELDQCC